MTCHINPMIINIQRKIPGCMLTRGAKTGYKTQASKPIGTVANAQMLNISHREYWGITVVVFAEDSLFMIYTYALRLLSTVS